MNKKFTLSLAALLSFILPHIAFAGVYVDCPPGNGGTTLCTLVDVTIGYFNIALVLLMSFAVLMFTYYIIQYYVKPNEDRKNAGQYVMYSIIGFFVILSLWGLVNILSNTFGGLGNRQNSSTLQDLPVFPTN
ncbi:MAG: hypothetical protein JWO00_549 [Candidatus Parcubacteria bacterium]|nr:hypothetical protein [Candidatus Parcubacteria bacterium]